MFATRAASLMRFKNAAMPMSRLALKNAMPFNAACVAASSRAFSNSAISGGASKLARALEKEIKYENDNYTQLEDIGTYLDDSGFKFSEEDNGINMTLSKTVGDKTVEVCFESR